MSQGETPGAGPLTFSGCGIGVKGLVAAVSKKQGAARISLLSGKSLSIDGRDFGDSAQTLGRFGRVRADVVQEGAAASAVDIFANDAIEIFGPNPALTGLFAVSSNAGTNSSASGGTVRAMSVKSTLTSTGNAIQAASTQTGGKGGSIDLQAKNSIVLDGAFLSAVGDFLGGNKSKGFGGRITVQSFAQGISWIAGGGDVRPVGSQIKAANQGVISLTTCGSSVLTNSQFPVGGNPIPPFPAETIACPATGPTLPPGVVLPLCISVPTITSPNTTTFTVGQPGTFTVTTTGVPTPSIARGGDALPSGVTFVDNGNGTGTLSGTPAVGTGGAYALMFEATNISGSSGVQNFHGRQLGHPDLHAHGQSSSGHHER